MLNNHQKLRKLFNNIIPIIGIPKYGQVIVNQWLYLYLKHGVIVSFRSQTKGNSSMKSIF